MALEDLRDRNMAPEERAAFESEVRRRSKSVAVGYVLWLFFGLHYAYVGKWGLQVLFWFTGGGLLVWWLIDFCSGSSVPTTNRCGTRLPYRSQRFATRVLRAHFRGAAKSFGEGRELGRPLRRRFAA